MLNHRQQMRKKHNTWESRNVINDYHLLSGMDTRM